MGIRSLHLPAVLLSFCYPFGPAGRSMTSRQLSFTDHRMCSGHGGPRPGAGRRARPRARVLHRRRASMPAAYPTLVTVRVRKGLPSLRSKRLVRELRRSFSRACDRGDFRLVHYSVQRNHVHMLVEAAGRAAVARGMKSINARFARSVNRVFGRSGSVVDGRYHSRVLRTPREVRNALAYVLLNARKHWVQRHHSLPPVRLDEASSARWFGGWTRDLHSGRTPALPPPVAQARTWLLRCGWVRRGLIDPGEVPG